MDAAFPTVLVVVVIVGAIVAFITFVGAGKLYEGIGRGGFSLDAPDKPAGPEPGSAAAQAEADEEIRQMLEAKSALRVERGEQPLDVEAEMAALTRSAPTVDDELREEVRQLVMARNERRMARGEEPLDVEAEVDRQLRDLGA